MLRLNGTNDVTPHAVARGNGNGKGRLSINVVKSL
jgi:hypothetical protein